MTPNSPSDNPGVLRQLGDPIADAALVHIVTGPQPAGIVHAVVAMMRDPANAPDGFGEWRRGVGVEQPPWLDPEAIRRGRDVFSMWSFQIAASLACASLPSAYAGADGARVLAAASDLQPPQHAGVGHPTPSNRVHRRLAETTQMLVNITTDESDRPFAPGSQPLATIRSVRLLHAAIRRGLIDGEFPEVHWDCAAWGVPVNQEDLIGTLCTFTTVVFDGLDRLGVRLSASDKADYLHLWSVVAWHLGLRCDQFPLDRPLDLETAGAWHQAIAADQHRPSAHGSGLAQALEAELRRQMPRWAKRVPATIMHRAAGSEIATMVGIPKPAPWIRVLPLVAVIGRRLTSIPGLRHTCGWPMRRIGRLVLSGYARGANGWRKPQFAAGSPGQEEQ